MKFFKNSSICISEMFENNRINMLLIKICLFKKRNLFPKNVKPEDVAAAILLSPQLQQALGS